MRFYRYDTRVGQAPGIEQYPRVRCRGSCELYPDQAALLGPIMRLTSLTTLRQIETRPNGWSLVHVETGPMQGTRGIVRSEDLVLVPSNVIQLPGTLPGAVTRPEAPGTGPFVPGGGPIEVERPSLPSPVQPVPLPDPGLPPPGAEPLPPDLSPPPRPWQNTAAEVLLLTSPAWGAVLLSTLLRPR